MAKKKVSRVLRDEDIVEVGMTEDQVLEAGGRFIDGCMEPPVVLFQYKGDPKWYAGTVEFCIEEAIPAAVQEAIAQAEMEE